LKIVVGTREKKMKIDAIIMSDNVNLSNESVETFEVNDEVFDHNPIGAVLSFTHTKEQVVV
jgi:hypothetical protein